MAMVVAYWHKDGIDVYRFVDKKPVKQASGSLDELKPIRGVFAKKVLIVARELLLHTRKRYPPAPINKLIKAVDLELGDLFPISKPAFHCRLYESSSTFTTLDIWAWESEPYGRLKEVFPFNYVIPEDLAYFSDVPEVKIFQYRGMTNILAHSGHQFLGGATYPDGTIDKKEMERFLSGIGRDRADIKRIKVYGSLPFQLKEVGGPEILKVAQEDHPLFMDYLSTLPLNEFKVKGDQRLSLIKVDLLCRVAIYLILGYGLMLYLTGKNYDYAASEIRQKIRAIDAKMSHGETGKKIEDYSDIAKEVNEKLSKRGSPLKVMETFAQSLPMGSFVNRMVFNENNLEVFLSSKEPITVVKALGAPVKDAATGSYNFIVNIELLR
jgi:hypothetical protein